MRRHYCFIKQLLLMVAIMAAAFPITAQDNEAEAAAEQDEREILLTKQYDELIDYWGGGNVIVKKNGKIGVVDADNRLFIPLQYDSIEEKELFYYVWQDNMMGVISYSGSPIIPVKYAYLQTFNSDDNYYFTAFLGDANCLEETEGDFEACGVTCGILDSIGNVVIPFSKYALIPIEASWEGTDQQIHYLAKADTKQKLMGVIDMQGQEVLPIGYDGILTTLFCGNLLVLKNSKYGVINLKGEEIIPLVYDKAVGDPFHDTLVLGKKVGETGGVNQYTYGFWDFKGHQLSDMVFSDVEANPFGYVLHIDGNTYNTLSFNEGLTPFYTYGEYDESSGEHLALFGYLDRQGMVAIAQQFSSAEPFSDGWAVVSLPNDTEELYGYIDTSGKMVLPAIYVEASAFVAGLGVVRTSDDEIIVIDKQGNCIMEVHGYGTEIIVDENGQTLIKVTGYDGNDRFYNTSRELVKMLVDGQYLYPRP